MSETTPDIQLTERELAVARAAAKFAIEEIASEFYRRVGKSVVSKVLIYIGLLAFGFGVAKGWITFTPPK
jgi:membrane-bound ClpP family serine protease